MFHNPHSSDVPSDKIMSLFIVQAIGAFVAQDYETGLHYLNEIKVTYASHQTTINPILKKLAKDIIKSLDMLTPGASSDLFLPEEDEGQIDHQPSQSQSTQTTSAQPTNVNSELQNLLNKRRQQKKDR
ncbi:MAG: hypothetical protein OEZ01_15240 [Candidatus Heimdallarchaeota archaeon]|nr:hypothetical protein [Candidatus Heimdallarchaeota archaeon]MDH5647363.1 hypothetical protein [Candidatus Heimdallarchaeota archaeon]